MKKFELTIQDDGTCTLADESGAEVGSYQTLDELSAALPDAVGVGPTEPTTEQIEGAPATEAAETLETESAEPVDGDKNYAQKKGMHPKTAPNIADYFKTDAK